jgi:enolase
MFIPFGAGQLQFATIAFLITRMNAGQITTGSLSRSDRIAKSNQSLRIEKDLGDTVVYSGPETVYNLRT